MFLVCLEDPEAAVFIDERVLEIAFALCFSNQTGFRNVFYIDLTFLAGILHLFVGFGFLFGVRKLDWFSVDPAQNTVQARDRSGIAPLTQFDPEHYQTGVRIPAAHILDELDFSICMLVRMAVGTVRAICQRLERTIVLLSPAVNVLPSSFIADGSFCDTVIVRILNYYLPKSHVLCYLIHSE